MTIEKKAEAPVVLEDSNLRYTILVKNLGPGDTTNVKVNDPLPTRRGAGLDPAPERDVSR